VSLGIIGGNGGKTTLLKTSWHIRELGGKLHWGTKVNMAIIAKSRGLEPRNEVIQELRRVDHRDNGTLRGFLANFFLWARMSSNSLGSFWRRKGRLALQLIYSQKMFLSSTTDQSSRYSVARIARKLSMSTTHDHRRQP